MNGGRRDGQTVGQTKTDRQSQTAPAIVRMKQKSHDSIIYMAMSYEPPENLLQRVSNEANSEFRR